MRYLYFVLFAFACASCNNSTKTANSESTDTTGRENTVENKTEPKPTGDNDACYMEVLKRDTIVLHLTNTTGADISGRLSFDNYEKDGSTGTVKGRREGDVLKLIYSFQSEGTNSVMEVYLREENDGMVRGVGEIGTKGDTAYFVHPDRISYSSNDMMKKTDCKDVPDKYK